MAKIEAYIPSKKHIELLLINASKVGIRPVFFEEIHIFEKFRCDLAGHSALKQIFL